LEGRKQKLIKCMELRDVIENSEFVNQHGVPDIIIVSVFLIYGEKILNFYLRQILMLEDDI